MLTVVKKNEQEILDALATELGFLTAIGIFDAEPLTFDGYQMEFLNNSKKYRWVVKARQVGFSFLFACEALARCHLRDGQTSVFVSYNLDDAKGKIAYARQLHDELPLAYRKRLVVDSKTELGFESNSMSKRVSRIVSVPSKAPRGKKGDIYLDELAHYTDDREVYKGSTALILRSKGQLTGCSSPLGRRGVFWEIAEQELRRYPAYSRQIVPWWLCRFFCNDVKAAAKQAPAMETEERVQVFGLQGIQDQYDSLMLEDFQQELEGKFVDESYSFYPYDLILPCTTDHLSFYSDFQAFPDRIRGRLTAGFDVGRNRDLSELVIVEEINGVYHLRLWRSYDRVPFAEQEADLARMMQVLPIARLSIDQSGIGMHLAENLQRRFDQYIRRENFTNQAKEIWCNDFRILLQHRNIVLPKNRELVSQIHSIKKRLTPSGKASFDAERSAGETRGHADRFWALVLACQKERFVMTEGDELDVQVRVVG